jgi:Cu+-exporting ATPase
LTVLGMTCAACSEAIERNLVAIDGVSRARATVQMQHVAIVHDPQVPLGLLKQAIEDAGFDVVDQDRSPGEKNEELKFTDELLRLKSAFYGSMTITTAIVGLEHVAGEQQSYLVQVLNAAAAILLQYRYGWWIHENAWRKAKRRVLSMDTLITASVIMGFTLSITNFIIFGFRTTETYFRMISALVMIVSGGRYLDFLSRKKAGNSTANLYGLVQQTYMVRLCSEEVSFSQIVYIPA